MFVIEKDSKTIHITRGDAAVFSFSAKDRETGNAHTFYPGDVVRFTVFEKKAPENVVLQKDFGVTEESERVIIELEKEDTKIGGAISKPVDYWYEVEVNPFSDPQTIVAYDEDGAKIFKLYPEGVRDTEETPITPEDIPIVDDHVSINSTRPVQNQAITRHVNSTFAGLLSYYATTFEELEIHIDAKIENEVDNAIAGIDGGIEGKIDDAMADLDNRVDEAISEALGNIDSEIYTTENKPTAEDVGAVPSTGGEISGDITIRKSMPVLKLKNTSSPSGSALTLEHLGVDADGKPYGGGVYHFTDETNYNGVRLNSLTFDEDRIPIVASNGIQFAINSNRYSLHGKHNKPSGSYLGNNGSKEILVCSDNSNKFLLVVGNGSTAIISNDECVIFSSTDNEIYYFPWAEDSSCAYFEDGVFYISSRAIDPRRHKILELLCCDGVIYEYQVL